jgi:hypothetical protein
LGATAPGLAKDPRWDCGASPTLESPFVQRPDRANSPLGSEKCASVVRDSAHSSASSLNRESIQQRVGRS